MSVAKVTEIIAASTVSVEDAVRQGVKRASKTINGIQAVWVKDIKDAAGPAPAGGQVK